MRKLAICAATVLLAACGSSDDDSDFTVETEDGTAEYDVDRDGDGAEIRFTDGDGNETVINTGGSGGEVNLPAGFTLYPGADVIMNNTMSGSTGEGVQLMMRSSDSADDLLAHYRGEAEAAGIEIGMEMNTADSKVIIGEGPDGLSFSFNTSEADGETTGMLTVGRQP